MATTASSASSAVPFAAPESRRAFHDSSQRFFERLDESLSYLRRADEYFLHDIRNEAEQAHELTKTEVAGLRRLERQEGVDPCYADAAAAYGRAVFNYDTAMSLAKHFYAGNEDVGDLDLANTMLAEAQDDRLRYLGLMFEAAAICDG